MNNNKICELSEKCPIYSGVLKSAESHTSPCKSIYCNSTEGKFKCKRYQIEKIYILDHNNLLNNLVGLDLNK